MSVNYHDRKYKVRVRKYDRSDQLFLRFNLLCWGRSSVSFKQTTEKPLESVMIWITTFRGKSYSLFNKKFQSGINIYQLNWITQCNNTDMITLWNWKAFAIDRTMRSNDEIITIQNGCSIKNFDSGLRIWTWTRPKIENWIVIQSTQICK